MDKFDLAHELVMFDAENRRLSKARRERARTAAGIIRDIAIREREAELAKEPAKAFEMWWEK